MIRAIYPASFDPITCGHVDIAERAARMFDELIIGIFSKPMKNLLFSTDERYQLTKDALAHIPNITIHTYNSMTIELAQTFDASVIVRGLRMISDFEWEFQLSLTNHTLAPTIDTICLMARQEYSFLSSSLLKDIARNHGPIEHLAPPVVVEALKAKFPNGNGQHKH